jgi:exopolysaccharide biosynthesis polyprenyl glycosylphosphotransferase
VGFSDNGPPEQGACVPEEQIYKLPDMPEILRNRVIDEVVVACPRSMLGSIVTVVDTCAAAGVPITLLSDIFGDYLPSPQVKRFGSLPALNFAPVHHSRIMLGVKRCIDVVGACAGLLVAAPIIAASVVAIKLTSPGPVFFPQDRCGLNGRRFKMVKLRTMREGADELKASLADLNEMEGDRAFKIRDDPRVTPVGRFLRRYSLDELPQFVDVLRGNMSLVGPRPSVPSEVDEYQTFERRRLSMRPGLTCIWQVSGRNNIGFEDWVRLDLEYIDTWSLTNDFKILFQTIPAVLRGTGAS